VGQPGNAHGPREVGAERVDPVTAPAPATRDDAGVSTSKNRALALGALLSAAVAVTLAGCVTATPVSQSGQPAPATIASPTAAPTTAPAPTTPAAGCPVTAATLEAAFTANAELAGAIVLGGGFARITCYHDYAVAHTTPTNVDPALVLFAYDPATGVWRALTGGTAVPCGEHGVPAAVVTHLPGCASD
jgi:hypothetical protein